MKNGSLIEPNQIDLPFASIIIPVYNSQNSIGECIESLLAQDYPKSKYEIIVVNNRSTDNTAKIVKGYPVQYVFEGINQSSYAARNTGVTHALGEALVFFDADQIAPANWLKNLLRKWDQEDYGAFCGQEVNILPEFPLLERYLQLPDKEHVQNNFVVLSTSCAACRRTPFEKLCGFDHSLVSGGDRDFGFRLQKELGLKIKYIQNAVFYHKQPRTNVLSALKRESRIAFGSSMLGSKHAEFKQSLCSFTVQALIRTIMGLGALMHGLIGPSETKKKKEHSLTILLDIGFRWAHCYGILLYCLGAQRCGDLPPGTKKR
jgi:glycosyltransferase AglI